MPTYAYNPNPAPLSQAELDQLAQQQAAMGGYVPPGGYQAQPAPAPTAAPYGRPDQGYAIQTSRYPPIPAEPASAPPAYGPPPSQGEMAQREGSGYPPPTAPTPSQLAQVARLFGPGPVPAGLLGYGLVPLAEQAHRLAYNAPTVPTGRALDSIRDLVTGTWDRGTGTRSPEADLQRATYDPILYPLLAGGRVMTHRAPPIAAWLTEWLRQHQPAPASPPPSALNARNVGATPYLPDQPLPVPSWDNTSGYGSVEARRAGYDFYRTGR